MSTQEYFCDCPARCKRRKLVSRTTYYDHARFRLGPHLGPALHEDYNAFAALHGVSASASSFPDPIPSGSGSSIGSGYKRSAPQSIDEEGSSGDSEGCTQQGLLAHGEDCAVSGLGGWENVDGPAGHLVYHSSCSYL
jgi:hypothetical protein